MQLDFEILEHLPLYIYLNYLNRQAWENSVDQDQTAPEGASYLLLTESGCNVDNFEF